jgi:hypothetical protein
VPVEETTTNRGYQKPYSTNELSVDVARLRSALDAIDTDVKTLLDSAGSGGSGLWLF